MASCWNVYLSKHRLNIGAPIREAVIDFIEIFHALSHSAVLEKTSPIRMTIEKRDRMQWRYKISRMVGMCPSELDRHLALRYCAAIVVKYWR
jgi:hypothetical protein